MEMQSEISSFFIYGDKNLRNKSAPCVHLFVDKYEKIHVLSFSFCKEIAFMEKDIFRDSLLLNIKRHNK